MDGVLVADMISRAYERCVNKFTQMPFLAPKQI